jgi:hypothetical protein
MLGQLLASGETMPAGLRNGRYKDPAGTLAKTLIVSFVYDKKETPAGNLTH